MPVKNGVGRTDTFFSASGGGFRCSLGQSLAHIDGKSGQEMRSGQGAFGKDTVDDILLPRQR